MLIAFKVHGLKGSRKYSAPLRDDPRLFFNKSALYNYVCSLHTLFLCMDEEHRGKKPCMHKHVDIIYSLVVIEGCQGAVRSWSVMTESAYGKCQQPEEPIQG